MQGPVAKSEPNPGLNQRPACSWVKRGGTFPPGFDHELHLPTFYVSCAIYLHSGALSAPTHAKNNERAAAAEDGPARDLWALSGLARRESLTEHQLREMDNSFSAPRFVEVATDLPLFLCRKGNASLTV